MRRRHCAERPRHCGRNAPVVRGEAMRTLLPLALIAVAGCSLPDEGSKPEPVQTSSVTALPAKQETASPPPAVAPAVTAQRIPHQPSEASPAPRAEQAPVALEAPPTREPAAPARKLVDSGSSQQKAPARTRMYLCRDGTASPTCVCGGPKRGCCSRHGGVAGCE